MRNLDGILGLVRFEWLGSPADIPGLEVFVSGKIQNSGVEPEDTATNYPGPKGNVVFNAATIW